MRFIRKLVMGLLRRPIELKSWAETRGQLNRGEVIYAEVRRLFDEVDFVVRTPDEHGELVRSRQDLGVEVFAIPKWLASAV